MAINISANCHRKNFRVGLNMPYIVHPFSVATILSEYTQDEDIFCAALLHDVIEDSNEYNFEQMTVDFGKRVTDIVRAITEEKNPDASLEMLSQSWDERKKKYLSGLASAPKESLMICAADSLHNLRSLIETYRKRGDGAWNSFAASIEKKMKFYGKIVLYLNSAIPSELTEKLTKTYIEAVSEFILKTPNQSSNLRDRKIIPYLKQAQK